jgi:hypothetical protein
VTIRAGQVLRLGMTAINRGIDLRKVMIYTPKLFAVRCHCLLVTIRRLFVH